MNSFCNNCEHKKIPSIMKEKYNKYVKLTFLECPLNDEFVKGCVIKNLNIKWKDFYNWLVQKEALNKNEKTILGREEWTISN